MPITFLVSPAFTLGSRQRAVYSETLEQSARSCEKLCIGAQTTAYNLCFQEQRERLGPMLFGCVVFFPFCEQGVADTPAVLPSVQKLVAH